MSSGPSCFTEKPRIGLSICMDETPRSARMMSHRDSPACADSRLAEPAKFERCARRSSDRNPTTEGGFPPWAFDGISIGTQQLSSWLEARENFLRVSAIAQRTIDREFARLGRKDFQDLRHHDWPVRASRRFSRRHDFGDGFRITPRIVFLIFLLKAARVLATVVRAALTRRRS